MGDLSVRRGWSADPDPVRAVDALASELDADGADLVMLFVAPHYDRDRLASAINARFDGRVVGCTTAGEVTPDGYRRGTLTGVCLKSDRLMVRDYLIEKVEGFGPQAAYAIGAKVRADVADMQAALPGAQAVGVLMIDGLSNQEDAVIGHLGNSVGGLPIVGGSAGDDNRNVETFVFQGGRFITGAAVFTTLVTTHRFRAIKVQHFESLDRRVVITGADPSTRIVSEIDGEPAATAFAKAIGVEPDKLSETDFSSHPLILRIGGEQYVRSVQRLDSTSQSLRCFSAIEEGLVLTVAKPRDIIAHTDRALAEASEAVGGARVVLGFECLHRRVELERQGIIEEAGKVAQRYNVVGFHTYGEQFGTIHVNQTFTGLALGD